MYSNESVESSGSDTTASKDKRSAKEIYKETIDPALQDGRYLPRWSKHSALGMHLGVSPTHSTTVGRMLNLRTGKIAPQYHVAHDELFTTVQGRLQYDALDPATLNELLELGGREHSLQFGS